MTVSTPVRQHIGILDAQGVSWRRMARGVGVSRRPVGRYAELEDCSPKPPGHAKAKSKPDPFRPVIDKWLESDRLMPRRRRHTAMRVWHRLRDEHGHEGSYQLVQRYVRQRKRDWRDPGDGFMELRWEPGVARVDFGEGLACIRGARVKVHCLVVAFPYSSMRWVVALPGENVECVCGGLGTVFGHIGLAPRVLVFDNATGAAHRVAWDGIAIVDVFRRFVEHYRVEVRFCDPAGGVGEGQRGERGRVPRAQPHGPHAQRGIVPGTHLLDALALRRDRLGHALPQGCPDLGPVRRGEDAHAAVAPGPVRRVPLGDAQGRPGGQRRDRFQPPPRRPLVARMDPGGRFARVPGGDPHPGRPVRGQAAARGAGPPGR